MRQQQHYDEDTKTEDDNESIDICRLVFHPGDNVLNA